MATRSNIAYKTEDGKIRSIYAHWDGYPECNGKILLDNYQDIEKIKALIELGSISSLGAEIGEKQDFDDRKTQKDSWTLAYHRDRGEDLHISEFDDIPSWIDSMEEYAYLWNGKEWIVNDHGERDDKTGFPIFNFVEDVLRPDVVKEIWG